MHSLCSFYIVDIFYKALQEKKFTSFLGKDSMLPMMYMPDCLRFVPCTASLPLFSLAHFPKRATLSILCAPPEWLKHRTYNVAAVSFTPEQLAAAIKKRIPEFEISYRPDFRYCSIFHFPSRSPVEIFIRVQYRQAIADSWPRSLDDSNARRDWKWAHEFDLDAMVDGLSLIFSLAKVDPNNTQIDMLAKLRIKLGIK